MPKITFFSLCLLAGFASNSSLAQSKDKSKPRPAKIEINWDQSPFNLESDNVGLNYEGHSCYQLFNALTSNELKKDEFESNSAYGSRIESLKSKKLFGDLSLDSFYAIVVGNSNNTVDFDYDPDSQVLNIKGGIKYLNQYFKRSSDSYHVYPAIPSEAFNEKREYYTASNSLGVKAKVQKTTYSACWTIMENILPISSSTTVKMRNVSPVLAKSLKGNVNIAYIGKVTKPFNIKVNSIHEPTLSNPSEYVFGGSAVILTLTDIWLIDRRNGEVIYKHRP